MTFCLCYYYSLITNTTTLEENFYHIDDDLLVKHLLGETSAPEAQQVEQWLQQDAGNADYFNQLKEAWEKSLQLAAVSTADENKAWERFRTRLQEEKQSPAPVLRGFSWKRIAAAAAIVIGIAAGLWWFTGQQSHEMSLASGMVVLTDTLPDGSVITLNKESSMVYASSIRSGQRKLQLKGEAFFDVAPDAKRPFVITVADVEVTVLGTSFNIKEDSAAIEVLVETGLVKVSRGETELLLQAGEKIKLNATDGVQQKEQVTDKLHNYYRSKEFVCDDTPLWKLVQVLNDAYKANIVFGRDELKELRLNTTFYNESLEKVLEVISLTFNITVRREDNRIILQ